MKFRILSIAVVVCAVLVTSSCNKSAKKPISGEVERSLEKAFDNPPESGRPAGYWGWLNKNVNKEAITPRPRELQGQRYEFGFAGLHR